MDSFELNINDFEDSRAFVQKLAEGYNPKGRASLVTSGSVDRYANATLTSRDITDIMAGGALGRNPATLMDLHTRFLQSSLHGILSAGAKHENFQVPNPDYTGTKGEQENLSGTDAFLRTITGSIMGTGLAPAKNTNPLLERLANEFNNNKSISYVGSSNMPVFKHKQIQYAANPDAPSLGERTVAIVNDLNKYELEIYYLRGAELNKRIPSSGLTIGYTFDIPDDLGDYVFHQTISNTPGSKTEERVDTGLITQTGTKALISAALIECLLMLTDPTKGTAIKGQFNVDKAILAKNERSDRTDEQLKNNIDPNNSNAISDHVFGRAFDIEGVGSFTNLQKSKEHYAAAFAFLLARLSTLPQSLLPDLIIISSDVARDIGVKEGFESANFIIKTQYPSLKYINFEGSEHHKSNIHISFGPSRAGRYVGSPGWTTSAGNIVGVQPGETAVNTPEVILGAKNKGYTNYLLRGRRKAFRSGCVHPAARIRSFLRIYCRNTGCHSC